MTALNESAARLLDVDRLRVRGAALIAVVRDHRVEEAWTSGRRLELEVRGRSLEVVPVAAGLLLRDLTGRRRAEESARELLAVLSHELRTPVTAVRAVLDALAADPDEALVQRFVPRALEEVERLTRLLDDLTVDVKPPRARRLRLTDVVARALDLLALLLEEREVSVTVDLPEAVVFADEDKLLQVMVNLLENAAVHGPAAERVELVAALEGEWLRLEVRDRGVPLDEAAAPALFEPHSRGRGSGKGTGLGLYIVRSIARSWGGEAWGGPRKDPGGATGNAFGVTVPLAR